jgi:hypothetical protein
MRWINVFAVAVVALALYVLTYAVTASAMS